MSTCFERMRPPDGAGAGGATPKNNESSGGAAIELDSLRRCITQLQALTQQVVELDGQCIRAPALEELEKRCSKHLEDRLQRVAEDLRLEFAATVAASARASAGAGGDGDAHDAQSRVSEDVAQLTARLSQLETDVAASAAAREAMPSEASNGQEASHGSHKKKSPRARGLVVPVDTSPNHSPRGSQEAQEDAPLTPRSQMEGSEAGGSQPDKDAAPEDLAVRPHAEEDTELGDCIWDAAMFIGHSSIGSCGSLLLLLLLLINVVCQVEFLGFSEKVLSQEGFSADDRAGLELWRMNIGQSAKYYDKLTLSSLSKRICEQSADKYPVEMSDGKSDLVSAMETYLPGEENLEDQMFSGPLLCGVALVCWTLTVMGETMAVSCRLSSILRAHKGRRTKIVHQDSSDKPYVLKTLGYTRALWGFFLGLGRLAAAVSLWYFGTLFLINYSIDPAELILNAVALEVVLCVPSSLFVMVPASTKNFFKNLEPLPGPKKVRQLRGLDCRACGFFVVLAVAIVISSVYSIWPMMERVGLAKDILCGGNLDFVYSLDTNYMVYSSKTNPYNMTLEALDVYPSKKAIRELIYPETVPNMSWYGNMAQLPLSLQYMGQGVDPILQVMSMTQDEVSDELQTFLSTTCADTVSSLIPVYRFMNEIGASGLAGWYFNVSTCADVASFCSAWPMTRSACPYTCGCNNATSSLALVGPADGCPQACTSATDERIVASLAEVACEEKDPDQLSTDTVWTSWVSQIDSKLNIIMQDWPDELELLCNSTVFGNCSGMFMTLGCGIIDYWPTQTQKMMGIGYDLCTGNMMGAVLKARPFAAKCPISCNCTSPSVERAPYCPTQCTTR